MSEFRLYKRKSVSEMRPYNPETDVMQGISLGVPEGIASISKADFENGSPKKGDMIARNPDDHSDLWLVAEKYFNDNLEEI